ncbi:MAG TPA: cytochrome b/b6 domain-containing protein [Anaerolineae bacterium]|nr:cytochrome b/b6 domain-containing protein [Anaerolineae bacterium]
MTKSKSLKVVRHSKPFIALHWLIFSEGLLLLLTGFSMSEGFNPIPIPLDIARPIHIVVAFAFLATSVFFLYYFVVSGEYKWFGLSRIGYAQDFFIEEIRAFLKGEKGETPVRYDPQSGDYVEKVVPTEVLAWWGWFLLGMGITLSGLGLLFPKTFGVTRDVAVSLRAAHFLIAVLIIVLALIHAYAAMVFGMWKSIFVGTREEPVVESS